MVENSDASNWAQLKIKCSAPWQKSQLNGLSADIDEEEKCVCKSLVTHPELLFTLKNEVEVEHVQLLQDFFEGDLDDDESGPAILTTLFPHGQRCWCFCASMLASILFFSFVNSVWPRRTAPWSLSCSGDCRGALPCHGKSYS